VKVVVDGEKFDRVKQLIDHKEEVKTLGYFVADLIREDAESHDDSKFNIDELSEAVRNSKRLKGLEYGSPEFEEELQLIIDEGVLHYERNDHHIEGNPNGVADMDLISLLIALCDWLSACNAYGGNIDESIEIARRRFGFSPEVASLMRNTVTRMNREVY
jgi:hypothetical protein